MLELYVKEEKAVMDSIPEKGRRLRNQRKSVEPKALWNDEMKNNCGIMKLNDYLSN